MNAEFWILTIGSWFVCIGILWACNRYEDRYSVPPGMWRHCCARLNDAPVDVPAGSECPWCGECERD